MGIDGQASGYQIASIGLIQGADDRLHAAQLHFSPSPKLANVDSDVREPFADERSAARGMHPPHGAAS